MDNQITILLLGLLSVGLILATSWVYEARPYLEEEIEQMKRSMKEAPYEQRETD